MKETREDPEPKRRGGFAKLPNSALLDFPRLMSGNVQILAILYINAENQWNGERQWTRPITHEELAKATRSTIRAVELKVKDLIDRSVLQAKRGPKGTMYHIPFETWADLPDMPSPVAELPAQEVEQAAEEESKEKPKFVPAFSSRLKVPAGKKTKPIKFCDDGLAEGIQFDSDVEIECDGFLRNDGVLRLSIRAIQERKAGEGYPKNISGDHPQVKQSIQSSNFSLYETAWLGHGINASPGDWSAARKEWAKLPMEQQLASVAGIQDRFAAGEYDEARFIPLPQNYLLKKLWMRPVRGRKKNSEEARRQEVQSNLEWAREMDRKAGRKR